MIGVAMLRAVLTSPRAGCSRAGSEPAVLPRAAALQLPRVPAAPRGPVRTGVCRGERQERLRVVVARAAGQHGRAALGRPAADGRGRPAGRAEGPGRRAQDGAEELRREAVRGGRGGHHGAVGGRA